MCMELSQKPAQRGARSVMMPDCIAKYNEGMLGVDLADWKTQKYRVGIKSKKWYFSICTHALDVALVNAHTIYNLRERHEQVDLLNFRAEVTLSLLKMDTPSKPAGRGRKVVHLPQRVLKHHIERTPGGKQRKCRVCKANYLQCRISCRLLQCIPQAILALYRLFTNTVTFRQVYFQNVFSFKSQNQSF